MLGHASNAPYALVIGSSATRTGARGLQSIFNGQLLLLILLVHHILNILHGLIVMFLNYVLAHKMVAEVRVILALLGTVVNLQLLQLVDLVYLLL